MGTEMAAQSSGQTAVGAGAQPAPEAKPIVPTAIFTVKSELGGYRFPFTSTFTHWRVETYRLETGREGRRQVEALTHRNATLRVVRDDGVTDYLVQDREGRVLPFEETYAREGLVIHQNDSPRTHKRLSRVLRQSLAFGVFQPEEVEVVELDVDTDLWDGINQVSRGLVRLMTAHLPVEVQAAYERCQRFEFTCVGPKGQAKGHALVVDDPVCRVFVPLGSWKPEIAFTKGLFLDIRPVHAHPHLLGDIQSLINIYHQVFDNDTLARWLHEESTKFLAAMQSGEAEERLTYLIAHMDDEKDYQQVKSFPLFEFLASGGRLHQSPAMTRQFAKTWVNRLLRWTGQEVKGIRWPIQGACRVYLTNSAAGGVCAPAGEAILDLRRASLFVSDQECVQIAQTLQGGDQDDALCVLTDGQRLLIHRQPNGFGQFVILKLANPDELARWNIQPVPIAWAKLEAILEREQPVFGSLNRAEPPCGLDGDPLDYPAYANWLLRRVQTRMCTLGQHVHVLTSCLLAGAGEPHQQPATLEAVIDAVAKDMDVDLSPVQAWDRATAEALSHLPQCREARRRLEGFGFDLSPAKNHWLDDLMERMDKHIQWFLEQAKGIADRATPPVVVYQNLSPELIDRGRAFRATYNRVLRNALLAGEVEEEDFEEALACCQELLAQSPDPDGMLLAAYALSAVADRSSSDACVWQRGLAHQTFAALRQAGMLGQMEWSGYSIVVSGAGNHPRTAHLQVNATWFNLLLATGAQYAQMREVPKARRDQLKALVEHHAPQLVGRWVMFAPEGERQACLNDAGLRLGTVAVGQEQPGPRRVVFVTALDGNLRLVLV